MPSQPVPLATLIADYKIRHGIDRDILRAVDFANQIIHADRYTWAQWTAQGQQAYPTCQPVPQNVIDLYHGAFSDFLDMRR